MTEPVTIINVLERSPVDLCNFLNATVLAVKLPQYTPNHPVDIRHDLVPLLSVLANSHSYVTELYCIVISAFFEQKGAKRGARIHFDPDRMNDLEAMKEILYRTRAHNCS